MQSFSHLVGAEGQKVDLDIRGREAGTGLEERPRRARGDRQWPLAKGRVSRAGQDPPNRAADDVIERDALGATHDHPDLHMILQIVPYSRRIEHDIDAVLAQQVRRPHAGQLQQLRRVIRAARNQDFLSRPRRSQNARLAEFDGIGSMSIEQNALRQRGGLDLQVLASPGGAEIRDRAVLALRPRRVVVWKNPAPSCEAPLKSGLTGMPVSAAAAMKAAERGSACTRSETGSGPPAPWKSSAPRSWFSAFLKYGRTSSKPHPLFPC